MNPITNLLLNDPATQVFFVAPLVLIILDLISAAVNAFQHHQFQTRLLGDFAHTNVMPYAGLLATYLAIPLLLHGVNQGVYDAASVAANVAMVAFTLSQAASVAENVSEIFGMPEASVESLLRLAIARFLPSVGQPPVASPGITVQPMGTDQFLARYGNSLTATGAILSTQAPSSEPSNDNAPEADAK